MAPRDHKDHRNNKELQMRLRLAQEAAHILLESGSNDYYAAKRKAALHLGAVDTRNMPSNSEIEEALQEYQRIFRADTQPAQLQKLREAALQAMRFFKDFRPRLVGSVLRGTADQHSKVTLHTYASTVEDIGFHLMQHHIPFQTSEKRIRYSAEQYKTIPVYQFLAEDTPLQVLVFPEDGSHQPPLSSIDGKPMQRADISTVEKLLVAKP
ncbi:MAG: hypothetical protein OQK73_07050 [Gammaproteobacteria bacterium]|nr:hypothetical protein [Gammaproteobacteria bacterium]